MNRSREGATYVGTFVSLLFFVALLVDPFREWIFMFLSDQNIDYYTMIYNPFTYSLIAFILFFVASISSLVRKTHFQLKVLCVAINGVGVVVVGFIVVMGNAL
ncbi:hypothetical protein [Alkalihalobacillus sp. R86527]|uniref:hypothetical protein n=1 Tax=Alkalihalobacillus sp. R86527 TaxID=3093863 RepID=UPI003672AB6C